MKKIGILGGVGWPSTVDYYTGLCRLAEAQHRAQGSAGIPSFPEMIIESLDLRTAMARFGQDDDEASWAEFDRYHREALLRLQAAGAEIAVMASNSPHHRFAAITHGLSLPVIDLFALVAETCGSFPSPQVILLGTALTLRSQVFRGHFARRGLRAAPPSAALQAEVVALLAAVHRGDTTSPAMLESLAQRALAEAGDRASVVCLACTELPLLFGREAEATVFVRDGICYLNPGALHVAALFQQAGGTEGSDRG